MAERLGASVTDCAVALLCVTGLSYVVALLLCVSKLLDLRGELHDFDVHAARNPGTYAPACQPPQAYYNFPGFCRECRRGPSYIRFGSQLCGPCWHLLEFRT